MVHSCHDLEQYVQFLQLVEEARAADHENPLKWAIQEAVRRNILRDYLERKGGEVLSILMTEYDYATCEAPCFLHNNRICSELTFLAFCREFRQERTNLACGQFCKEMIELVAPATCESVCMTPSMNCVPQKCTRNPAIEDSGPCSGGWPRETKATARWEAHHCLPPS